MFACTRVPGVILTDHSAPFISKLMKELCKLLNSKHMHTSVYHPQMDGLAEQFNKALKSMLKRVGDKDGRQNK